MLERAKKVATEQSMEINKSFDTIQKKIDHLSKEVRKKSHRGKSKSRTPNAYLASFASMPLSQEREEKSML